MSNINTPYMITDTTITVMVGNHVYSCSRQSLQGEQVLAAIREGRFFDLDRLIDPVAYIKTLCNQYQNVSINNGVIYIDGCALPDALCSRMLKIMAEGIQVEPMLRFLHRLSANPSQRAIHELYRFLEANSLPITPNGTFLAYKRIRDNYTDVYTGTINNRVGDVVSMPRNQVMDDPNQTCSTGLHFASLEYLKHYAGDRLVAIEIDPADVVSIPVDYNNSKGRCCKYRVATELDINLVYGTKDAWDSPVVDTEYNEDEYHS